MKIPTLYDVLKYEASKAADGQNTFSETLLGVCTFLHERGVAVLKKITLHITEPQHVNIEEGKRDWERVRSRNWF